MIRRTVTHAALLPSPARSAEPKPKSLVVLSTSTSELDRAVPATWVPVTPEPHTTTTLRCHRCDRQRRATWTALRELGWYGDDARRRFLCPICVAVELRAAR